MDFYLIRHLTKFLYASQVSESLMEARMHPRSDNNQRCLSFSSVRQSSLPGFFVSRSSGQQRASL